MPRFTGLIVATFAPLRADGELNLAAVDAQVQAFQKQGADGVYVNGTTGEGASLTVEERELLARRWCAAAKGLFPVLVQVGSQSLAESKHLAQQAQADGAAAISCVAPNYFKPATIPDLVEFCKEAAAAAPALPFYYYQIPIRTGVMFPLFGFLSAAVEQIPTLAGAKFSHQDLMDFLRCVRFADGRLDILYGLDEMLLPALALGAQGAVGTTYNFASPVYRRLLSAFAKGDLATARIEQARAIEMIACLGKYDFLPAAKCLMRLIGLDCGPVRLPLRTLSSAKEAQLRQDLEAIGYFNWGRN
jgi:N-acetylneuraminate lyase